MAFFAELKRRRVFQVAAVYVVVAWLIMQVVDVVNEPLSLPDWFDTVAILLLAIGFPIAVIASWAFEITPEGIVRDQGAPVAAGSGRRLEYGLIGLLLIAVVWIAFRELSRPSVGAPDVLPNSVAVLPFENLSLNPEDAFFAGGLHDELLSRLAQISGLNVIARTSVMQYEGVDRPISEIAAELRVQAIMEGTVRYDAENGQVRITAQLNDGRAGTHIWSDTYTRPFENIFEIETDIATTIARELEAELIGSELERIEKTPTESPAAWAFYLKALNALVLGSAYFGGESAALEADSYLDEAIDLDPNFALAYTKKARLYIEGENTGQEGLAEEYINSALALNPNLGEAHALLGDLNVRGWRLQDALSAYMEARELAPNDPNVLRSYGNLSSFLGMHEEAIAAAQRILEIDPVGGNRDLGIAYWFSGQIDRAVEQLRRASSIDPTSIAFHIELIGALLATGETAEAAGHLEIVERLLPDDAGGLVIAAYYYSRLGRTQDAVSLLTRYQRMVADADFVLAASPQIYAYQAAGENELALARMEAVATSNEPLTFGLMLQIYNLTGDPALAQPAFLEVRRRLGFRE